MGEVVPMRRPEHPAHRQLDEIASLKSEKVPSNARPLVAAEIGRLAQLIGPTAKKGIAEIARRAGREDLLPHRRRVALLPGERTEPDHQFRRAWSDYIALAEAAARILHPLPADQDQRLQLLRRVINPGLPAEARPVGSEQDLFNAYLASLERRVLDGLRSEGLDHRLLDSTEWFGQAVKSTYGVCHIRLGYAAVRLKARIHRFPDFIVERCPTILLEGREGWEGDEEDRVFEDWGWSIRDRWNDYDKPFDDAGGWQEQDCAIYMPIDVGLRLDQRNGSLRLTIEGGDGDYQRLLLSPPSYASLSVLYNGNSHKIDHFTRFCYDRSSVEAPFGWIGANYTWVSILSDELDLSRPLGAARAPSLVSFNYWHAWEGDEVFGLIDGDDRCFEGVAGRWRYCKFRGNLGDRPPLSGIMEDILDARSCEHQFIPTELKCPPAVADKVLKRGSFAEALVANMTRAPLAERLDTLLIKKVRSTVACDAVQQRERLQQWHDLESQLRTWDAP